MFISVVAGILIISCATTQSMKQYYKQSLFDFGDIDIKKIPKASDYPDANGIYLIKEGYYKIDRISTFSEHVIFKVLTEGGKRYANVKVRFWTDSEILDLHARTIKANGEIVAVKDSTIYEVSDFPDYVLYADNKAKVFTFPSVDTGCVMEYYYTLGIKGPYVPQWYFQATEPILVAKFSYDVPKYFGFNYVYSTIEGVDINKEIMDTQNENRGTFTTRNLPAIKEEPLSPTNADKSSWLLMSWKSITLPFLGEISSGQESWFQIGKNYSKMFDEILAKDKSLKSKARDLVARCAGDDACIRLISDYIARNFRYVAVEVKGHSIFPHAPGKVMENQYGDCKDLAGLMIGLLRASGIDAYPVLARTKDAGKLIQEFPTYNQFNHVIVAIPLKYFKDEMSVVGAVVYGEKEFTDEDDVVIVDPTVSTLPLGKTHQGIQNTQAVLCAGDNSRLISLPGANMRDNFVFSQNTFSAGTDTYEGNIKLRMEGEDAVLVRNGLRRSNYQENLKFIHHYMDGYPVQVNVDTFTVNAIDEFGSPLEICINFSEKGSMQQVGKQLFIPLMLPAVEDFDVLYNSSDRQFSIRFPYPYIQNDKLCIAIPTGFKVSSLPERESEKTDWIEYSCASYISGDTAFINRSVAVKVCDIPKDNFVEIKALAKKILDSNQKILILSRD